MSDASVNMVLNVKTIRLIRDGEKGGRGYGGGGRGRLYSLATDLHCHHHNDFGIKMDSDESHFNVSLIVRANVTNKTMSTNHNI